MGAWIYESDFSIPLAAGGLGALMRLLMEEGLPDSLRSGACGGHPSRGCETAGDNSRCDRRFIHANRAGKAWRGGAA